MPDTRTFTFYIKTCSISNKVANDPKIYDKQTHLQCVRKIRPLPITLLIPNVIGCNSKTNGQIHTDRNKLIVSIDAAYKCNGNRSVLNDAAIFLILNATKIDTTGIFVTLGLKTSHVSNRSKPISPKKCGRYARVLLFQKLLHCLSIAF
jgi:hypothetical protein